MKTQSNLDHYTVITAAMLFLATDGAKAAGGPERGQREFLACVSCHSAEPKLHKTGPSLANIWGKKAGTVDHFGRYSEAILNSEIVWNAKTLEAWLRNPLAVIPGTFMRIPGLENESKRQDIIAYLKHISPVSGEPALKPDAGANPADLSDPSPDYQVTALRLCQKTYHVKMMNGETHKFWEFNLRLKTDSTDKGPPKGQPALVSSGMRGDRASLVFASPSEISPFIEEKC